MRNIKYNKTNGLIGKQLNDRYGVYKFTKEKLPTRRPKTVTLLCIVFQGSEYVVSKIVLFLSVA